MVYVAADNRYEHMQYRRSGHSGLKLPLISFGLWHNFGGVDARETGKEMIRKAFDLGITHFDLANNYGPPPGSAEEFFWRDAQDRFGALQRRAHYFQQSRLQDVGRPLWRLGFKKNTSYPAWIKA